MSELPNSGRATPVLRAVIAGGLAGFAAAMVFAMLHAIIIVPIWDRMAFGIASATAVGLSAGWAFVELGFDRAASSESKSWAAYAMAGLRFGALLFLAVTPVTLADTVLRLTGVAPRLELVAVAVALVLAVTAGWLIGSRFGRTRRAKIAGVITILLLTIAMAGPVPLPNGRRAVGIFLAVLPACLVAGLVLGLAVRALRRAGLPAKPVNS